MCARMVRADSESYVQWKYNLQASSRTKNHYNVTLRSDYNRIGSDTKIPKNQENDPPASARCDKGKLLDLKYDLTSLVHPWMRSVQETHSGKGNAKRDLPKKVLWTLGGTKLVEHGK